MKTDDGTAAISAALALYAARLGAETEHTPALCARAALMMRAADRALKAWTVKKCNVPMSVAQDAAGWKRLQRMQDKANAWLADDVCDGKGRPAPTFDCIHGMSGVVIIPGTKGNGWGAEGGAWTFNS